MALDNIGTRETLDPQQETAQLRLDIEKGLEQPAPFTAGYRFKIEGGNENLRDPGTRQIKRRTEEGDIFSVIQTLPARGHYQYVLIKGEDGQQFSLCINDSLQQIPLQAETSPSPARKTNETAVQVEASPVFHGILQVLKQENLRDPNNHSIIKVAHAGEIFPIIKSDYEQRGAYKYALVMVDETPCKICTNDKNNVRVDTGEPKNLPLTPPIPEIKEAAAEPEVVDPHLPNQLSSTQVSTLERSSQRLTAGAQKAFSTMQTQVKAVNQESTRGPSPVHFESGNQVQLDYGSLFGQDIDLSSDNWDSVNTEDQAAVVNALNLWWNASFAPPSETERIQSSSAEGVSNNYQKFTESDESDQTTVGKSLISDLVNLCQESPGPESVALVAEYYQRLLDDGHPELAEILADQIILNSTLVNSPVYSEFCAVVQNSPSPQSNTLRAVNSIDLSQLPPPTTSRPFRLIQQEKQLILSYNGQTVDPQPEGKFTLPEQASIVKELNNKIEPLFDRYDSGMERFGKQALDLFGDYSSNNITNAVLARLRSEPNFLNALPEDRQDEAACAAFMTRYLENLYGSSFSSYSGIGGRNAWEYAHTLEDSGYGIISADLSSNYTIDPVRAQNPRDKGAILLEDPEGTLEAQISHYVEAAFSPDASGGIATFHYRLTAANDDIVNTPHSSPNSHVTNILGSRDYTVPAQGRSVAQDLMQHFSNSIRLYDGGHPEYLQHLKNVHSGDTALTYDVQQADFIDENGQVYRPQRGETITFQDVEVAHFYHKHQGDTDPVRRDGLVALMVTGLFEPVQIIEMNPGAVTTPNLEQDFNKNFITKVRHEPQPLSLKDIRTIYQNEYTQIQPALSSYEVNQLTDQSIKYLTANIYASIFRNTIASQAVFPANSPLPIIDWREQPTT